MSKDTVAAGSSCYCFTGSSYNAAVVYLLNQIAGGTMDPTTIAANSHCYCLTGVQFERAVIYLLDQILAGGGGGGGSVGVTDGSGAPPNDGTITTRFYRDTSVDPNEIWFNAGASTAAPQWYPI